ncbi:MAG: hypothetical protein DMG76_29370 [Acidobacteria bacterium]|nr:MAG: hypothetical protein DMG76_29370 [Acidobacteriota bacterium]
MNRGLEPTYLIYVRSADGSEDLAGSFFTLEEAKLRVRLMAQKSGRSHYIYDSLKHEVIEERTQSDFGVSG